MEIPKHCAPFYVFRESVIITDISEDDYRAAKGLVPKRDIREYPDPSLINVWDLRDGDLSKVGINGMDVFRPDLRSSVSIRDRFEVDTPSFLDNLFNNVKIGVGSKHIYIAKDFMRKHRDARLPDLDGLPHVMTMVIFSPAGRNYRYSGGRLLINDIDALESYKHYNDDKYGNQIVLFPITSIHEVTEITRGERHTFVFPVYGHFDPFSRIVKRVSNTEYTTVYDEILDEIDTMPDSDNSDRAMFLSKLEVLKDESLCRKFVMYRIGQGDCVPYEHNHGISEDDHIEEMPEILSEIRETVGRLKLRFEDAIRANIEMAKEQECKLTIDDLPKNAFAYVAKNLYFSDTSIKDLRGVDAHIYQLASSAKRKIHLSFVNLNEFINSDSLIPVFIANLDASQMTQISRLGLPRSEYISEIQTTYDDQGGYDPRYTRLYCTMFIGHVDDIIVD